MTTNNDTHSMTMTDRTHTEAEVVERLIPILRQRVSRMTTEQLLQCRWLLTGGDPRAADSVHDLFVGLGGPSHPAAL